MVGTRKEHEDDEEEDGDEGEKYEDTWRRLVMAVRRMTVIMVTMM